MPRGDGTGPIGNGPMTGQGQGFCAVQVGTGFGNRNGFGRAMGRGRGCGSGWRNRFNNGGTIGVGRRADAGNTEDELTSLENECTQMEEYLKQLRSRVEELKSQSGK